MHVHQSVWKGGQNLFAGDGYAGPVGLRALLHRRRHQAREGAQRDHQPGHQLLQAPRARLRGADQPRLLRAQPLGLLPHPVRRRARRAAASRCASPTRRRTRTSRFAALLMAGLDGVQNKIHPGDPLDKNLYDLEPEEAAKVPHPCASLDEALDNLDKDREFLTRGGVFTNDMHRRLHRAQVRGGAALPHDHAPRRVRHVLLGLKPAGAVVGKGRPRPPLFAFAARPTACGRLRRKPPAYSAFSA